MIDDPRVLSIEVVESGEPLVDGRESGLRTAFDHPRATSSAPTRFWCRQSVLERLLEANRSLPRNVDLVLTEAHRPLALQRQYWDTDLRTLMKAHPDLSPEAAAIENAKYVAPPWIVPPHTTGGAVDVVLFATDTELLMGCELNEQCEAMRTDYSALSGQNARNRTMLVEAMLAAGFVNYGHEWWHYSFGDRYWAFQTSAEVAIYGGL